MGNLCGGDQVTLLDFELEGARRPQLARWRQESEWDAVAGAGLDADALLLSSHATEAAVAFVIRVLEDSALEHHELPSALSEGERDCIAEFFRARDPSIDRRLAALEGDHLVLATLPESEALKRQNRRLREEVAAMRQRVDGSTRKQFLASTCE
eukprot:TRINITY_DN14687_c0_g1_i1.p2 TRINITY_DN14687_c0_g1~~TRINITY_DN14687_c0_g1_i1.p2  ORF type:complete len:154 (+),score=43.38 TRINITY_DN14687_c0_g1_i1:81-542(+)